MPQFHSSTIYKYMTITKILLHNYTSIYEQKEMQVAGENMINPSKSSGY